MKPENLRIELSTFTYGGESLGRLPDGRVVFVPFALPGEIVEARIIEQKRGFARAELIEVITPSNDRISPRCPHFGECGGCQYQMLGYECQLSAKESIISDQLTRIGKLKNPHMKPIIPSSKDFNYRNFIQFHLTPSGKLGFHRSRSEEVIPITECHLPEKLINHIVGQVELENMSDISQVSIRLGVGEDIQIILESNDLQTPEILVEELPVSVVHLSPTGPLVLVGSEIVFFEILNRTFQVSPASFFQVNTPMAGAMVSHILKFLDSFGLLSAQTIVVDAYCGVGLFSAFLAPRVGQLIGIETSPSSCEDFIVNLDEFDNVSLYESSVEIVLPNLHIQPDIVIVDPPRAGLDRRAMDRLVNLSPELVIYVSCDPSTLARDAKRLISAGYQLKQVTPFDLFPQTHHIESISVWIR